MISDKSIIKGAGCLVLCLTFLLLNLGTAYAETVSVPLNIAVQAASVDFEITESIHMAKADDSTVLTIEDLVITNSASNVLELALTEIAIETEGEWELVADTTDFSTAVNKKKFSLVTAEHDFYSGSYTGAAHIIPGESKVISFSGHTGSFTEAVSEKAADMIVTLKPTPRTFTFEIKLEMVGGTWTTFYAEEGMTWGEWVESEYNTEGFVLCGNGGCHILHPQNYTVFDSKGNYWVRLNAAIVENYRYQLTVNYEQYN